LAPGVEKVGRELLVVDLIELDADPSAYAYVRRQVELFGLALDEARLGTGRNREPNGDVSVVVVIVDEHCIDFFLHEKRRFPVGEFLGRVGQGAAETADAAEVFFAGREFWGGTFHDGL